MWIKYQNLNCINIPDFYVSEPIFTAEILTLDNVQRTPTTLQPRLAAQTRSRGHHHERVPDLRCTSLASCSIGGCDPSSVITASPPHLLCCACCVMRATFHASGARHEKKKENVRLYGNFYEKKISLVISSNGHDARCSI